MADWSNPNSNLIICPLPPIKPLAPRGTGGFLAKQIAANWATYDNAKAKFDACIKQKNDELYNATHPNKSPDGGLSPALHKFNLSNPAFAGARGPYLLLLDMNAFGWASIWYAMSMDADQSYFNRAKAIWFNVGGDISVLKIHVDKGRVKRAVFKPKGWAPFSGYSNSDGGASAYVTLGAAVIGALGGVMSEYVKANPKKVPQPAANETTITDSNIGSLKDPNGNSVAKISVWKQIPTPVKAIGGTLLGLLVLTGLFRVLRPA